MNIDTDTFSINKMPKLLEDTKIISDILKAKDYKELKELWQCNEKIASLNYERLKSMDLLNSLTPAILAYEGLQYQHMAPQVFSQNALDYIEDRLRILSGFYGVLTPFTGVVPYRLEMQAKLQINDKKDLYDFWSDKLYKEVIDTDKTIINLASKEYSKAIQKHIKDDDRFINVEFVIEENGKIKQKATHAKMARGQMVRFMAENSIDCVDDIKKFNDNGYEFSKEYSDENKIVFIRKL